jgi:hypothetical protein
MIAVTNPGVEGTKIMSPTKHHDTCAVHDKMIGKEEFRWVVGGISGGLVLIFLAIIGYAVATFASNDKVQAIDVRLIKVENTLDTVKTINNKLDILIENAKPKR